MLNHIRTFRSEEDKVPSIGITAIVPPEIFYARGCRSVDLNNWVVGLEEAPSDKLCAWTAAWRDILLDDPSLIDGLVVVAGGDCHNALVDGQRIAHETDIPVHYFFYPFDGDEGYLLRELEGLDEFVAEIAQKKAARPDDSAPNIIHQVKLRCCELDRLRCKRDLDPGEVFKLLIAASDMMGDVQAYSKACDKLYQQWRLEKHPEPPKELKPVAIIGVPPIMDDFHKVCWDVGLKVVFDEMPYEFVERGGTTLEEMATSYAKYTFARPLEFRFENLKEVIAKREVAGLIHYTQYACHHTLEDPLLRKEFDIPLLTLQGDLPRPVDRQIRLRLEAFYESL